MRFLNVVVIIASLSFLSCDFSLNPNGPPPSNDPYFITTEVSVVKEITIPIGTRLEYQKKWFKEGKQSSAMNEKYLTGIVLTEGETIDWGGVPITTIYKFFNSEMSGYSVYADFDVLPSNETSTFYELWKLEGCELGITVKDRDNWSFNKDNILDVESCSVLYQRYFKEDKRQQDFLDKMYAALQQVTN